MKQRRERSMNDPAIQSILSDPIMTQVTHHSACSVVQDQSNDFDVGQQRCICMSFYCRWVV